MDHALAATSSRKFRLAYPLGLVRQIRGLRRSRYGKELALPQRGVPPTLFGAMRTGGMVGFEHVEWFNGGLFDSDDALPLSAEDIRLVARAADLDWAIIYLTPQAARGRMAEAK